MIVRCPDCKEMAKAILEDNSFDHEFGTQEVYAVVSNCCEAQLDISPEELEEEEPDYD